MKVSSNLEYTHVHVRSLLFCIDVPQLRSVGHFTLMGETEKAHLDGSVGYGPDSRGLFPNGDIGCCLLYHVEACFGAAFPKLVDREPICGGSRKVFEM
jgi:hypothetical protein